MQKQDFVKRGGKVLGMIIGITMMAIGFVMDIFGFVQIHTDTAGYFQKYTYTPPFTSHETNIIAIVVIGSFVFLIGLIVTIISHSSAKRKKEQMSATVMVVKKFTCPKCGVNLSTDCTKCPNCGMDVSEKRYQ